MRMPSINIAEIFAIWPFDVLSYPNRILTRPIHDNNTTFFSSNEGIALTISGRPKLF